MRLLIEVGYEKLLLLESANVAAVLEALAAATVVEQKNQSNYSDPPIYAAKQKGSGFQAPTFISHEQLIDEDEAAEIDIETLRKRNATLQTEAMKAVRKLEALEKKVSELTKE